MRLLMIGGSLHHLGGVEAFCERGREALQRSSGWHVSYLPAGTAFLTFRRIPILIDGLRKLFAYRQKHIDCIWLQYVSFPDLVYLLFAKLFGFKIMVTPHLGSNWRSQANPTLRYLSGSILRLADRLALISPTQELEINLPPTLPRSLIRNFLPERLLSAELPAEGSPPDRMHLLHSGRLSEGKGTFLFVEVCNRLKQAGFAFHASITGGADEKTISRLKDLIDKHNLGDHVALLGRIPEDELLDLFQKSDVLIHLSKIDSYPLIVLETTACCVFPICMELAGARDMIETYDGHIVSPASPTIDVVSFLSKQNLGDLRARSRSAAMRVRRDYAWINCAAVAEAALLATAHPPALVSSSSAHESNRNA